MESPVNKMILLNQRVDDQVFIDTNINESDYILQYRYNYYDKLNWSQINNVLNYNRFKIIVNDFKIKYLIRK